MNSAILFATTLYVLSSKAFAGVNIGDAIIVRGEASPISWKAVISKIYGPYIDVQIDQRTWPHPVRTRTVLLAETGRTDGCVEPNGVKLCVGDSVFTAFGKSAVVAGIFPTGGVALDIPSGNDYGPGAQYQNIAAWAVALPKGCVDGFCVDELVYFKDTVVPYSATIKGVFPHHAALVCDNAGCWESSTEKLMHPMDRKEFRSLSERLSQKASAIGESAKSLESAEERFKLGWGLIAHPSLFP